MYVLAIKTIWYAERVSERIVVSGTKEKGGEQERVENMEAKNLPHGRTLTTSNLESSSQWFYGQHVKLRSKSDTILWVRTHTLYLSIYGIYITPLPGNYSEVLAAQAKSKRKVFRSLYKELDRSRCYESNSDDRI